MIEKLLDVGFDDDGNQRFLVKWKNYPASDNSWVIASDISEQAKIDFFKAQAKQRKKGSANKFVYLGPMGQSVAHNGFHSFLQNHVGANSWCFTSGGHM